MKLKRKIENEMTKNNQRIKARCNNLWIGEGLFQDGKFAYSWVKGSCFGPMTHWMPNNMTT